METSEFTAASFARRVNYDAFIGFFSKETLKFSAARFARRMEYGVFIELFSKETLKVPRGAHRARPGARKNGRARVLTARRRGQQPARRTRKWRRKRRSKKAEAEAAFRIGGGVCIQSRGHSFEHSFRLHF